MVDANSIMHFFSPAALSLIGMNAAALVWTARMFFRLGQELKGIKLTLEYIKSDLSDMHEYVDDIQEKLSAAYMLSHCEARKFLHYHEDKTNPIKRI